MINICKTRLALNVQNVLKYKNVGFSSLNSFLFFRNVCQNVYQNVCQGLGDRVINNFIGNSL